MKTEFKVGMKVYDSIGVGIVKCIGLDGYPIVTYSTKMAATITFISVMLILSI